MLTHHKLDSEFWRLAGLSTFVALDLETTGLDPAEDSIIELGAVRFENGSVAERFSQLVDPQCQISAFITELTGIKNKDLKGQPILNEVADDFISFVGKAPVVGHNVAFDLGFLAAAIPTSFHFNKNRTIPLTHDTGLTARYLHPCLDGYGLAHLTRQFKTSKKSCHRATADAEATGELFAILLARAAAIPLKELSLGLRFVEGTSSPLSNTLRSLHSAVSALPDLSAPVPDPLLGHSGSRTNIYTVKGSDRPTEPVKDEHMRKLFKHSGRFQAIIPAYHIRREQIGMAEEAAAAFRDDSILVVEAGTGVGKSMAYLVPSLLSGDRVVISTFTKNLQDQLFQDEIPRLGELFKFGFKSALLKGRRNYLCQTKWNNWAINPERISNPVSREKAALISRWVGATRTGDVSEINSLRGDQRDGFYNLVVSEPGYCTGRGCGNGQDCPMQRIRKAALKADLLIVNHSLVMTDILSDGGVLGEFGKIVFDEAHHLEDVATDQFGTDLTAPALKATLERISRLCRRNGELWVTLSAKGELESLSNKAEKVASDAGDLFDSVNLLFDQARGMFESRMAKNAQYSESFRYSVGDQVHKELAESGAPLSDGLAPIKKVLSDIREKLQELEDGENPVGVTQELQAILEQLGGMLDSLLLSITADDENRVHWVELPPEINRPVRLRTAPLDVSELLSEGLWKRIKSALLTSATLATGPGSEGFNHLSARFGLDLIDSERVKKARFGSPFDFKNNCLVCYPSYLTSPPESFTEHCREVAEICAELAMKHRRCMLLLFTSYAAMRTVAGELKQMVSGDKAELLVQNRPGGNVRLVRRFRHTKGAILLGTNALWEGIDVPGDALQIVVIPRLPFDVPNDPVIAARIDKIREQGGNPFFEFQLPSAVLRMRQGAGRLIRTMQDRGVVLILDSRSVTKRYGLQFRRALAGEMMISNNPAELMEGIDRFFTSDLK